MTASMPLRTVSRAWLCDPDDPRVVAALARQCPACATPKGQRCQMAGAPLVGGRITHEIRVPDTLIFAEFDTDADHLPAEKVQG